jgi:8-oxo-dGTP pyrophosphatase MutT (NUDIX family)
MDGKLSLPKHFTASAFVLRSDRRLLLLHHDKLGVWLYPGGHVEESETPDTAAIREVLEESGRHVRILGERDAALDDPDNGVHALHTPYRVLCERIPDARGPHDHIDMIYLCEPVSAADGQDFEADGIGFFSFEQTHSLKLFPNFRRMLADVYRNDRLWQSLRVHVQEHAL